MSSLFRKIIPVDISEDFSDYARAMKVHADLIDALGGGTVVAAELQQRTGEDFDRERIYKWKYGVPWRWRVHVAAFAAEKNVPLPINFLVAEANDAA